MIKFRIYRNQHSCLLTFFILIFICRFYASVFYILLNYILFEQFYYLGVIAVCDVERLEDLEKSKIEVLKTDYIICRLKV